MGGVQKWAWYLGGAKNRITQSAAVALSRSAFEFFAVDVGQFGLPINEQVAQISIVILLFTVVICVLLPCSK